MILRIVRMSASDMNDIDFGWLQECTSVSATASPIETSGPMPRVKTARCRWYTALSAPSRNAASASFSLGGCCINPPRSGNRIVLQQPRADDRSGGIVTGR